MYSRRPFARISGALLTLALPAAAAAARIDYELELGAEHNDNVNLSEDNPVSENILVPALGFTADQEGSTVQASASGRIEYRDYLGGEFSDEFRGQLAGHLNWTLVPERLNLTVEDNAGVQPVNSLQPNTPSNQQQTNVFAIGPTLSFRLGPTVRGQAELRYVSSYAEETREFNSNRLSAALRAIKDLNPTSTLSANIVDERIQFTENETTAGPDYSRYSAYGRYTRQWNKIDFSTDLGYSWLRYTGSTIEDRDNPLARAKLDWRASERSTFTADVAYQFSDAASFFSETPIAQTIPTNIATGDATVTSQAFLERRIGLGYAYKGERLSFDAAPFYRKLDYSTSRLIGATGLDQTGKGATAGITYLLRPLLGVGLIASGENLRYQDLAREDKTWSITAFLRQQWSRHWSGRAEFTRYRRDSTEPGQSADQNIFFVAVTYTR